MLNLFVAGFSTGVALMCIIDGYALAAVLNIGAAALNFWIFSRRDN